MNDMWTDRLSEYMDGALSPADTAALERHLTECDDCVTILGELREVVGAAGAAEGILPERDLWSGIAARIEQGTDVLPLRPVARRFSFSLPQLAAAAVVLMAFSGGAVYLLQQDQPAVQTASGTIAQNAAGGAVRLVADEPPAADPQVVADVAALEQALAESRDRLDPATVEVVERSLESIDVALRAATDALEADPGNPYLHRQLDNTMRKKLDLLRRATGTQRVGT